MQSDCYPVTSTLALTYSSLTGGHLAGRSSCTFRGSSHESRRVLAAAGAAYYMSHPVPHAAVQHAAAKRVSHLQELPHVRWAACSHLHHPPLRQRLQLLNPCLPDQGHSVQRPGYRPACCARTAHAPLAVPGSSSPAGLQAGGGSVLHPRLSLCRVASLQLLCSPVTCRVISRGSTQEHLAKDTLQHAAHALSAWQTQYESDCSLLVLLYKRNRSSSQPAVH